jgi:hypothetical protein
MVRDSNDFLELSCNGFDVACGFLHADRQYRDSLVYDLMELFRPAVDALVLAFLERTTFTYGDSARLSDGQCRLHPQLVRAVVATYGLDWVSVEGRTLALHALVFGARAIILQQCYPPDCIPAHRQ